MKIEFRKIPLQASDFELYSDSVKFSGTFSKINSKLASIKGSLEGPCKFDCYKCGQPVEVNLAEKVDFLVSDGIYSKDTDEDEIVVIEVFNHSVDFDEILNSEIESLRSDYVQCENCKDNDYIDIEY